MSKLTEYALKRQASPLCRVLADLHDHLKRDARAAQAEISHLRASVDDMPDDDLYEWLERVLTNVDAAIERGDMLGAEIMVDCARFERDSAAVEDAYHDAVTERRVAA